VSLPDHKEREVIVPEKCCRSCKQIKPAMEFYKKSAAKDGLEATCKLCTRKKQKTRYYENKNNPKHQKRLKDYNRKQHLAKYGITLEGYIKLLQEQDFKCAICRIEKDLQKPNGKGTCSASLCVDHNHKTGKIRGLLCSNCNFALGLLKEDVNIAKTLVKYLENNNG